MKSARRREEKLCPEDLHTPRAHRRAYSVTAIESADKKTAHKSGLRRRPDSNRRSGFCRPLPYHLATSPLCQGGLYLPIMLAGAPPIVKCFRRMYPVRLNGGSKTFRLHSRDIAMNDQMILCERCGVTFLWTIEDQRSATGRPRRLPGVWAARSSCQTRREQGGWLSGTARARNTVSSRRTPGRTSSLTAPASSMSAACDRAIWSNLRSRRARKGPKPWKSNCFSDPEKRSRGQTLPFDPGTPA